MKRAVYLILALVMCLSLCACEKGTNETGSKVPMETAIVIDEIKITKSDTYTYTNGSNLIVDEFGQISELVKERNEEKCWFEYADDGSVCKMNSVWKGINGLLTTQTEILYENGIPDYSEYKTTFVGGSPRKTKMSPETNEKGQITILTESHTYTDQEDGSISRRTDKNEYIYDGSGKVVNIKNYSGGKQDHTTVITYDESGNILEYKNVAASNNSVYLSVKFSYKTVDKNSVKSKDIDNFTTVYNFTEMLNYLL